MSESSVRFILMEDLKAERAGSRVMATKRDEASEGSSPE